MHRLARLAACTALALTACSSPRLVVASDLENPPFAELDAAGAPRGRDVEMTEELARRTGRELEWVRLPFDRLLSAVETGEVDVAVATLGRTPERAERVRFSGTYYATAIVALVRADDGALADLDDLAGHRVAAGTGTTSERAVRERLPNATIAEAAKGGSSLERLLAGDVDAVVLDQPDALEALASHPGRVRVLPTALAAEDYAIAVRPDRAGLVDELDRALAAMRTDGTLAELDRRHGL